MESIGGYMNEVDLYPRVPHLTRARAARPLCLAHRRQWAPTANLPMHLSLLTAGPRINLFSLLRLTITRMDVTFCKRKVPYTSCTDRSQPQHQLLSALWITPMLKRMQCILSRRAAQILSIFLSPPMIGYRDFCPLF
jgi:hypothetical protein